MNWSLHRRSPFPTSYRFLIIPFILQDTVRCWATPPRTRRPGFHNTRFPENRYLPFHSRRVCFATSSIMSEVLDQDFTSLQGLENYAQALVDSNKERDETSRISVCIVVAGGGGHAISTLAATPGASSLLLEGSVTYDRRSYRSYVGLSPTKKFHYNSMEAAKLASEAALKRALNFKGPKLNQMNGCIGIGCSSALVSSSSADTDRGTGYIVATRADGAQLSVEVTLAAKTDSKPTRRTRKEEDIFVSHLILRCIDLVQQADTGITQQSSITTSAGDEIHQEWGSDLPDSVDSHQSGEYIAAQRLLSGDDHALILLPVYKEGRPVGFRAQKFAVIPNGSLVMPGSFNPPHKGHIKLGKAASMAAIRKGFSIRHNEKPLFMELSLVNADKPAIDPGTAADRVHRFLELEDFPEHWGIILTRAPLFAQKVASLQECILDHTDGPLSKISFVIGSDTLMRILNPKYYNNDENEMIRVLRSMEGAHFIAGGRLEQNTDNGEARFITGDEHLAGLPQDLKDKFTIITEQEFRVDLSSTQIREAERLAAAAVQRDN